MGISLLSIFILSCKIVSSACLLISIHSYHWFQIDNYADNRPLIGNLCISYGAFCNVEDQMPLPRIIIITPCVLVTISLVLEIINIGLLCSTGNHTRSMLNFFLELTSIALTSALTIHCTWMTIVHIRISMEMSMVHLDWTFFAFTFGALLIPIDCVCSISRVISNCQYEKSSQSHHSAQIYACRHRSLNESDI